MTSIMLPPNPFNAKLNAQVSGLRFSAQPVPLRFGLVSTPVKDIVHFGARKAIKKLHPERTMVQPVREGLFVSNAKDAPNTIRLKETTTQPQAGNNISSYQITLKDDLEHVALNGGRTKNLGSIQLKPEAAKLYQIEVFQGKDLPNTPVNYYVSVTDKQTGNVYIALPGTDDLKLPGLRIKLPKGADISAQPTVVPKLGVYSSHPQKQKDVEVLLLGGGVGSRMHPLTLDELHTAKPALYMGPYSMLGMQLDHLYQQGFRDYTVDTFFKPESVTTRLHEAMADIVDQNKDDQPRLNEFRDYAAAGSAGGLGKMLDTPEQYTQFDGDRDTLILQGDAVVNLRFDEILKAHRESKALVSVVATERPKQDAVKTFGVIKTDTGSTGNVLSFVEKPADMEAFDKQGIDGKTCMVNTGIYLFSPEGTRLLHERYKEMLKKYETDRAVFESKPENAGKAFNRFEFDFGKHFFDWLPKAMSNHDIELPPECDTVLHCQVADGYWNDVGNPREYLETVRDVMSQKLGLNISDQAVAECFDKESGVVYAPGAKTHLPEKAVLKGNIIVTRPFSIAE